MNNAKPRKVNAKITRTVTEIATVYLDRNGDIEEHQESLEELDSETTELHHIISTFSTH